MSGTSSAPLVKLFAAAALIALMAFSVVMAIIGSLSSSSMGCGGAANVSMPAAGTGGQTLRGKVSWFGGPNDSMSGPTTASGLPVTQPGIAIYNSETLRGYWVVRFPNGRTAVLQQTDFGPAPWTGRVVDVLSSALPALGYTEGNFPTDAQVVARYLGKNPKYSSIAIGLGRNQLPSGAAPNTAPADCNDPSLTNAGVPGKVVLAPGANRAGVPMQRITLAFVAQMAAIAGRQIVITTGTNHSQFTVNGGVSDHWAGYAADIGMGGNGGTIGGPVGDRIMTACLILGGMPPAQAAATARGGGLFTLYNRGLRIQCIWKTFAGGNHYDHVHAAARPM